MAMINNRTCPHCHKKVSIINCLFYVIRGVGFSIQCNHCGNGIIPEKEPIPFHFAFISGFLAIVVPMQISLYVFHNNFLDSLVYGIFALSLDIIILIILTITTIKFKKLFY